MPGRKKKRARCFKRERKVQFAFWEQDFVGGGEFAIALTPFELQTIWADTVLQEGH